MSGYFEFTDNLTDYTDIDLEFESMLFEFDSPDPEVPESVFFLFEGGSPVLPPGTPFDPSEGIILSFRDPRALNPYNAIQITGLDASKIKPKYYRGSFGDKFYNLTPEDRQIVLLVGLNPDYAANQSYSELRDFLYRVVTYSKTGEVELFFKNGNQVVAIVSGFVTKVSTALFEDSPDIQVTIQCDDSMLRSPDPVDVNIDVLSLTDANIQDLVSTSPHGFSFQLEFTAHVADLTITDPNDSSWIFKIVPLAGGFKAGDVLHFTNDMNRKQLYIERGATLINLLNRVSVESIWPIIFPGDNHFNFSNSGALDWVSMSYYRSYWGI